MKDENEACDCIHCDTCGDRLISVQLFEGEWMNIVTALDMLLDNLVEGEATDLLVDIVQDMCQQINPERYAAAEAQVEAEEELLARALADDK